jgi:hypothetical protein
MTYTVCTQNLIREFRLPFLEPIPAVFVWIALAAWGLTFAGLVWHLVTSRREGTMQVAPVPDEVPVGKPQSGHVAH